MGDDNLIDLDKRRFKKELEAFADEYDVAAAVALFYERISDASVSTDMDQPINQIYLFLSQLPPIKELIHTFARYVHNVSGPEAQEFVMRYDALVKATADDLRKAEDEFKSSNNI